MVDRYMHPYCMQEAKSKGRKIPEAPDPYRTCYTRDRDRILHSKSFRRLKHKTQVFLKPEGDHYRTRLTHTLEVMQIARTVARAIGLNEDLVEAICLGHDLGHTPFGHAGERVLNRIVDGGFHHVRQSVRVVEVVERNYQGLNLTYEVIDGILKHSKGKGPILGSTEFRSSTTMEAQVVRICDLIAYLHHDCDDAIRAGCLTGDDIPEVIQTHLGKTPNERLTTFIRALVEGNKISQVGELHVDENILDLLKQFRAFMFEAVYESPQVRNLFEMPEALLEKMTYHYLKNHVDFIADSSIYEKIPDIHDMSDVQRMPYIVDFVSGMTDAYALSLGHKHGWTK